MRKKGASSVQRRKSKNLFLSAADSVTNTEDKDLFYDSVSVEVLKVHGKCVHLGDFVMWAKKVINMKMCTNGLDMVTKMLMERVLEFADSFKLKIVNTWFKKDVEKLVTYESGGLKTVIDYVLVKKEKVKNVKAIQAKR